MMIYVSSTIIFLHWHVVSFPGTSHVVTCFLLSQVHLLMDLHTPVIQLPVLWP